MNELYRAYRNSCETQTNNWVEVPEGLFAVVAECPAHCPVTDAVLPNPSRVIMELCGTRRIAEYHARRLNKEAEEAQDYDVHHVVWPREPRSALPADWDDMPF